MLDWLFGVLIGDIGVFNVGAMMLMVVQVVMVVVLLVIVGRARKYRLEAERYWMRTEEAARMVRKRFDSDGLADDVAERVLAQLDRSDTRVFPAVRDRADWFFGRGIADDEDGEGDGGRGR